MRVAIVTDRTRESRTMVSSSFGGYALEIIQTIICNKPLLLLLLFTYSEIIIGNNIKTVV